MVVDRDVVLDYRLADPENPCSAASLRDADEMELRYGCFAGDITFTVGSADFSARWGWVTVLDFALCMQFVVSALDGGSTEERLDFSENEAEIVFARRGTDVQITATYTPDTAVIPLQALFGTINRFARRVVAELEQHYPDLATNAAAQAMTRPVLGGAS